MNRDTVAILMAAAAALNGEWNDPVIGFSPLLIRFNQKPNRARPVKKSVRKRLRYGRREVAK